MIIAVVISIVSLSFGFYETIQSRSNEAFIYEQAYRIIGTIQDSKLTSSGKAQLTDAALNVLGRPQPVLDLSRSSADTQSASEICSTSLRNSCTAVAASLAAANQECSKANGASSACDEATAYRSQINELNCLICYTP